MTRQAALQTLARLAQHYVAALDSDIERMDVGSRRSTYMIAAMESRRAIEEARAALGMA
jgi:hypothetical protein